MANTRARPVCACCGEPYYRRNLLVLWDGVNPGHRVGWHQSAIRVCTTCLSQPKVRRMVLAIMGVIGEVQSLKASLNFRKNVLGIRGRRYKLAS